MKNSWQLYESMDGWEAAAAALDAAFEQAKLLAPEQPATERALMARDHVRKTMETYRGFGACDTEPDVELMDRINRHFGTDVWRW